MSPLHNDPPLFSNNARWKVLALGLSSLLVVAGLYFASTRGRVAAPTPTDPAPSEPADSPRGKSPTTDATAAKSAKGDGSVLGEFIAMLDSGRKHLEDAQDFQGVLHKQERLGGVLGDPQEVRVKMRRDPTAVYLNWENDSGKEILWRKGQDDGKLLLHPGGWKGRLTPVLRIAPDHKLVQGLTRRPVEKIGLWKMGNELHERQPALHKSEISMTMDDYTSPCGRECQSFRILDSERQEDDYDHITVVYVDRIWKIAVGCDVYGWPEEGEEPPLLESYFYSQIEFNVGLSDRDFDPANPAYGFAGARKELQ